MKGWSLLDLSQDVQSFFRLCVCIEKKILAQFAFWNIPFKFRGRGIILLKSPRVIYLPMKYGGFDETIYFIPFAT